MTNQNSIYAPTPIALAKGGTANTGTLANGQLWVGNGTTTPAIANLSEGTNVTITNGAGTITINSDVPNAIVLPDPSSPVTLVHNTTYICTNTSGTVQFTLPTSVTVGEFYRIIGSGSVAIGWTINQNAGQQIVLGSVSSTTGTSGTVSATAVGDSIIVYAETSLKFIGIPIFGQVSAI